MKAVPRLPEHYKEMLRIDLQKDKKLALIVNILAIVIAVVLAVPAHFVVPIFSLFNMESGFGNYLLRFVVLLLAIVLLIYSVRLCLYLCSSCTCSVEVRLVIVQAV